MATRVIPFSREWGYFCKNIGPSSNGLICRFTLDNVLTGQFRTENLNTDVIFLDFRRFKKIACKFIKPGNYFFFTYLFQSNQK